MVGLLRLHLEQDLPQPARREVVHGLVVGLRQDYSVVAEGAALVVSRHPKLVEELRRLSDGVQVLLPGLDGTTWRALYR